MSQKFYFILTVIVTIVFGFFFFPLPRVEVLNATKNQLSPQSHVRVHFLDTYREFTDIRRGEYVKHSWYRIVMLLPVDWVPEIGDLREVRFYPAAGPRGENVVEDFELAIFPHTPQSGYHAEAEYARNKGATYYYAKAYIKGDFDIPANAPYVFEATLELCTPADCQPVTVQSHIIKTRNLFFVSRIVAAITASI